MTAVLEAVLLVVCAAGLLLPTYSRVSPGPGSDPLLVGGADGSQQADRVAPPDAPTSDTPTRSAPGLERA